MSVSRFEFKNYQRIKRFISVLNEKNFSTYNITRRSIQCFTLIKSATARKFHRPSPMKDELAE